MQLPLKKTQKPAKIQILDFVDQYFETTPVEQITTEEILNKLTSLLRATPFTSTICHLLPVGMELEMEPALVQEFLSKAYEAAKSNDDIAEVYHLAVQYNNTSIYGIAKGTESKEFEQIIQQAIRNSRTGHYRRSEGKTIAQAIH